MSRSTALTLLVAVAAACIGLIAQNGIPIGVFHDDGQYLILARSIAEHGTYRFDNLPGAPPGLHYPPGFPFVLALVWRIAPDTPAAFKCANALLLGGAGIAIAAFAKHVFGLGERIAAAVAVAIVASAPFVWLNSLLISETLFIAMLCATLAADASRRDAGDRSSLAIGALAGATALVRSLADPLGPLLVCERLWRRRWRDAALIAVPWAVLVVPWKLWVLAHRADLSAPLVGAYGDYTHWWRDATAALGPGFVANTLTLNVSQLPLTLTAFGWNGVPVLHWFAVVATLAIAGVGVWAARRTAVVTLVFAAFYVAIVMIWPFAPDRFLLVLGPLVGAAFVRGAIEKGTAVLSGPRAVQLGGAAVALVLAIGFAGTYVDAFRTRPWLDGLGKRGTAGSAAARLVATLPRDARIATDFDELVHLQTARVVVPARSLIAADYTGAANDSVGGMRLRAVLDAFHITHVVVADVPTLRAATWLGAHGVPLVPVASDSGGAVVFARSAAQPNRVP